jgi:hypothetical protein
MLTCESPPLGWGRGARSPRADGGHDARGAPSRFLSTPPRRDEGRPRSWGSADALAGRQAPGRDRRWNQGRAAAPRWRRSVRGTPDHLRQRLGLKSGGRLEAELVGGTVVLRPAAAAPRQAEPETQASEAPVATTPTAPSANAAIPGKRKPGRSREAQAVEPGTDSPPDNPEPPAKCRPGWRRKVRIAEEPTPAAVPVSGAGEPSILRRKAELLAANVSDEAAAAPARRPARVGFDTGYTREERHPFRHVEVRKLGGPGRGHNRPRQKASG